MRANVAQNWGHWKSAGFGNFAQTHTMEPKTSETFTAFSALILQTFCKTLNNPLLSYVGFRSVENLGREVG